MRHFCRILILSSFLLSANSYAAVEIFLDPLYWRATENVDFYHSSNLDATNLVIGFKTITYDFAPGFRVGAAYEGNFDTKLYYTKFYTRAKDSASGNLTTEYLGGRLAQTTPTSFYKTGQADFRINFNMIDWNVGKHFDVSNTLMLRPLVGLEAGVINQTFNTNFQGQYTPSTGITNNNFALTENITNNFFGIGPKIGIESKLVFFQKNDFVYSLVANFETSYLWGSWNIRDIQQNNSSGTVIVNVANRDVGSLGLQGMMGAGLNYKNFSMKLAYELSDWTNQCQFFDDETGTKNTDLYLQGLTLSFSYKF